MKSTRFELGKKWKQDKINGVPTLDFEKYYLEFKEEIDKELSPVKVETKSSGKK